MLDKYMGTHTKSVRRSAGSDEVTTILDSIRRIVHVLRIGSRAAEKQVGLSGAQLFVLQTLAERQALSLNELAERTRTHQSSVSVVVQRLSDRGLVTRTPSAQDTRRVKLSLTSTARKLLAEAPDAVQHRLIAAMNAMPVSDRKQLSALLSDFVNGIGVKDEAPGMFFEDQSASARCRVQPNHKTHQIKTSADVRK